MRPLPTDFADQFEVLQVSPDLTPQANDAITAAAAHGFVAATGLQRARAGDITVMAAEPHIREFCPNDESRFGSEPQMVRWLQQGRKMVGLYAVHDVISVSLNEADSLTPADVQQAACGWYGLARQMVTTAYRVGTVGQWLAAERRFDEHDRFKLGLPLGEIVTAVALRDGVMPGQLSLETWASNSGANRLYDQMRYRQPDWFKPEPADRPTLRPVGDVITVPGLGERTVRYDQELQTAVVEDLRLFKTYQPDAA